MKRNKGFCKGCLMTTEKVIKVCLMTSALVNTCALSTNKQSMIYTYMYMYGFLKSLLKQVKT